MMAQLAISETITTISEAEKRLGLSRAELADFFTEWVSSLPDISQTDQVNLETLWNRYLYHRSEGHLLESTVMLLLVSPLLTVAGFYDPPFRIKAEESVRLTVSDSEDVLQGRIDVLILLDRLWVMVLESKKTMLSVWSAVPQALAYLQANPELNRPTFGMLTNGDDILFIKIQDNHYAFSRVFSPLFSQSDLSLALQVLRRISRVVQF
ncbi:MAG: type I restriction enzyme HsdR N-terminal domain-containing protein [Snowella sp.]|nr:type I restriction enzyme HsdR N-terminal domain-containing protein [Snowella sp.]